MARYDAVEAINTQITYETATGNVDVLRTAKARIKYYWYHKTALARYYAGLLRLSKRYSIV